MNRKPRIVVGDASRSWLRWILIVVVVAAGLAVAGWFGYRHVRTRAVSIFDHAVAQRDRLHGANLDLSQQLRAARAENQELKDKLAFIGRSKDIDKDACSLVKQSLSGMQRKIANLNEQLAFYRGIVSPKASATGLRVYDFKLAKAPVADPRVYDFEVLLVQALHHDNQVRGRASLKVQGVLGGKQKVFSLADLAIDKRENLVFSFRYFEELDGRLKLPDGFRPTRVTISLDPNGSGPVVTRSYDWRKLKQETEVKP